MKIDQNNLIVGSQQLTNMSSSQEFEQLLNQEDYYRDHKNQLQQNELQFNKAVSSQKKSSELKAPELRSHEAPHDDKLSMPMTKHHSVTKQLNKVVSSQFTADNTLLQSRVFGSAVDQQSHDVEHVFKSLDKILTAMAKTAVPSRTQLMLNRFDFQSHHLFIENNRVELALNHLELSKEQSKILIKQVNDLLRSKGYLIKRITINGEKQQKETSHDSTS